MLRYSQSEIESLVRQIDTEAKMAGLLPNGHHVYYSAGNPTNGISAEVYVFDGDSGTRVHGYGDFLPEFTYRQGKTEQYKVLTATLLVFHAFRRQRKA
jgi:hypothetical protein